MAKETMKAVVFDGPQKVSVIDRPVPKIQEPGDMIVKVIYTALCGSELHVFRVRPLENARTCLQLTCQQGAPTEPDRLHYGK